MEINKSPMLFGVAAEVTYLAGFGDVLNLICHLAGRFSVSLGFFFLFVSFIPWKCKSLCFLLMMYLVQRVSVCFCISLLLLFKFIQKKFTVEKIIF